MEDLRCPICLNDVKQPRLSPCCFKVFCDLCLRTAFTTSSVDSDDDEPNQVANGSVNNGDNYSPLSPAYQSMQDTLADTISDAVNRRQPVLPVYQSSQDTLADAISDVVVTAISNHNDSNVDALADEDDDPDNLIAGHCPHCRKYGFFTNFVKNPIAERVQADFEKMRTESENRIKALEERLRKQEEKMATMIEAKADVCPSHSPHRKTLFCAVCRVPRCQECHHPGHPIDFIENIHALATSAFEASASKISRLQNMEKLGCDYEKRRQDVVARGVAFLMQRTREMCAGLTRGMSEANKDVNSFFADFQRFWAQAVPELEALRVAKDSPMLNRLVEARTTHKRFEDGANKILALAEATRGIVDPGDVSFNLGKIMRPWFDNWAVVTTAVVQLVPGSTPTESYQIRSKEDDTGPWILDIEEEVREANNMDGEEVVVIDEAMLAKFDEGTRSILHPRGNGEKFATRIWRFFVRFTGKFPNAVSWPQELEISFEHFDETLFENDLASTGTSPSASMTPSTTSTPMTTTIPLTAMPSTMTPPTMATEPGTTTPSTATSLTTTPLTTTTSTITPLTLTTSTTMPLTTTPSTATPSTLPSAMSPSTSMPTKAHAFLSFIDSISAQPRSNFYSSVDSYREIRITGAWTELEKWFRNGKFHVLLKLRRRSEGEDEEDEEEEKEDANEEGSTRSYSGSPLPEGEEDSNWSPVTPEEPRSHTGSTQEPSTSSCSIADLSLSALGITEGVKDEEGKLIFSLVASRKRKLDEEAKQKEAEKEASKRQRRDSELHQDIGAGGEAEGQGNGENDVEVAASRKENKEE